jgi:transposase
MTKYHIKQAEIRYSIDGYKCQKCNKNLFTQQFSGLAHRLSKSKVNLKKYGSKVINHNFNLVASCLEHNHLYLIDNKPAKTIELIFLIETRGNELLTTNEINEILEK